MVHKRRSREEVDRWLRLREERGLSLRELSRRSGIPAGTLGWWLHRRRAEAGGAGFLEVKVRDEGRHTETTLGEARPSARLRVDLPSGVAVTLDGEYAQRLAEALLAALQRW